jgi:hypothetical protein
VQSVYEAAGGDEGFVLPGSQPGQQDCLRLRLELLR